MVYFEIMCLVQNNLYWVIRVYWYIICCFLTLLFLSKQLVLSQYWANIIPIIDSILYIGLWSIANMLHQYYTIIGCRYEANANVVNGNPILSHCGLTRERQHQYRQWETNVGPIFSCFFFVLFCFFFVLFCFCFVSLCLLVVCLFLLLLLLLF